VSRVGGNAQQIKAMKQVAGRLRLDLAQYRELEAFAQFGSSSNQATQSSCPRGRVVEVLKHRIPADARVEAAGHGHLRRDNGYLDDVPVDQIRAWEQGFRDFMAAQHPDLGEEIGPQSAGPTISPPTARAIAEYKQIAAR